MGAAVKRFQDAGGHKWWYEEPVARKRSTEEKLFPRGGDARGSSGPAMSNLKKRGRDARALRASVVKPEDARNTQGLGEQA